jgi:serine/threonine-protein kinase RsbW
MAASLSIGAELSNLGDIRRFVEDAALALQAEADATADVVLAVNEIATNIIEHGYRRRPGTIEIDVRQNDDALVVRLRDQAPPFDPTRAPAPDLSLSLDQRRFGGMGIHMARHLVDQLIYQGGTDGGNELTLVKKGIIRNHPQGGDR